jgi:hypothetical protein
VINLTVSYETEYKQVLIKKQLISLNPSGSVNNGQTQTTQGTSTDNSQSQQSTSPAESSSNQAQNIEVIREKFFNKSNPWLWVSSATIGLILASLAAVFIVKSRKEKTIEDKLDQLK